jgi:hypothetical protein
MSYDMRLVIDTGGEYPACVTGDYRNPTYNLAPMFQRALGCPLRDLDGMTGAQAAPIVATGLERMRVDKAGHEALNPPNGWGDYDGAVETLEWLHGACLAHPKATVRV